MSEEKQFFIITSYGRTGTQWLTQALNLHSEIYCSHGPTFSSQANVPGDEHYINLVNQESQSFVGLPVVAMLDKLANYAGGKRFVGNVHGYAAVNLFRANMTDAPPFRRLNLIRHPVTRLDSFVKSWKNQFEINPELKAQMTHQMETSPFIDSVYTRLARRFPLQKTDEVKLFLLSLEHIRLDADDATFPIQSVPFERLVKDIEYFLWFASYITGGKAHITNDYAQKVIALHPQDAWAIQKPSERTSLQILQQWEPWQCAALEALFSDYPRLYELYENMGYCLTPFKDTKSRLTIVSTNNQQRYENNYGKPTLWQKIKARIA